jgi:hypothetical protein
MQEVYAQAQRTTRRRIKSVRLRTLGGIATVLIIGTSIMTNFNPASVALLVLISVGTLCIALAGTVFTDEDIVLSAKV